MTWHDFSAREISRPPAGSAVQTPAVVSMFLFRSKGKHILSTSVGSTLRTLRLLDLDQLNNKYQIGTDPMFRRFTTASYSKLTPTYTKHVSPSRATSDQKLSRFFSRQRNNTLLFNSASKRRLENSPTLRLEAVALSDSVKEQIRKYIARQSLSGRQIRSCAKTINLPRAPESLRKKVTRNLGQPIVLPPPAYDPNQAAAFVAVRMPGTFSSNIFVMAEAARLSPDFVPRSILDFGSGPGTSFLAASRVFSHSRTVPTSEDTQPKKLPPIHRASLVDSSPHMRSLAAEITQVDPWISSRTNVVHLSSLQECQPEETFDIVSCSYSLNELVRDGMSSSSSDSTSTDQRHSISREERRHSGAKQLRRAAKALWSRTAPNGLLIIIEDGTAAGFETVAFVRETILKASPPLSVTMNESSLGSVTTEKDSEGDSRQLTQPTTRAHVVAPCLHSTSCPLNGSITGHRICRFQQRLNRPPVSRTTLPMPTGYEDEYFSFLVIQKVVTEEHEIRNNVDAKSPRWGRLIRQPLQKGKHVTLDACTNEAKLERRVVSKKNAPEGMYSQARRAKWGDVWANTPSGAPQRLNF